VGDRIDLRDQRRGHVDRDVLAFHDPHITLIYTSPLGMQGIMHNR